MTGINRVLIQPFIKLCALAYLRWAQRSMCASHPDSAYVTLRIAHWEQK